MYYRSVDELPLKILFKIFDTNDFKFLVKEYSNRDKISVEKLKISWEGIIEEYKKLDKSNKIDRVLRLSQKIDFLKATHEMVSLCIYVLRLGRDEDVEQRLLRAGYKVDADDFLNSLDRIESDANGLKTKIGIKTSELEKLTKDESIVKSDINEMLASMSSILGIAFKFNEITVVEFFGYKSALEKKIQRETQQKGNRHGRR